MTRFVEMLGLPTTLSEVGVTERRSGTRSRRRRWRMSRMGGNRRSRRKRRWGGFWIWCGRIGI